MMDSARNKGKFDISIVKDFNDFKAGAISSCFKV